MPKFSQRYGYSPVEKAFQKESIDTTLRTKIWNILKVMIWDRYDSERRRYDEMSKRIDQMVLRLWVNYFDRDLDHLPSFSGIYGKTGAYDILKNHFMNCQWFEVYDLLEEMANDNSRLISDSILKGLNNAFEEHNSAYRFVGTEIVEITDKNEIHAIETALETAETPVRTHLEAALRMLSDRETPDYRNSVKESISAVEAVCRIITGDTSATLGDALRRVQNLHPAMSRAFNQLYGFTSDASGIRQKNQQLLMLMLNSCWSLVLRLFRI